MKGQIKNKFYFKGFWFCDSLFAFIISADRILYGAYTFSNFFRSMVIVAVITVLVYWLLLSERKDERKKLENVIKLDEEDYQRFVTRFGKSLFHRKFNAILSLLFVILYSTTLLFLLILCLGQPHALCFCGYAFLLIGGIIVNLAGEETVYEYGFEKYESH